MLSTLAPFADELWVGPFYPRRPGEESYALCFAIPMDTPGLKFICREPYDDGRSRFDRPVSSRFDEEDALAAFFYEEPPSEAPKTRGESSKESLPIYPHHNSLLRVAMRRMLPLRLQPAQWSLSTNM